MQTTLNPMLPRTSSVRETAAQRAAESYLVQTLGAGYAATSGFYGNGRWNFLICLQPDTEIATTGIGKLAVDAMSGTVIELSAEQLQTVSEQATLLAAPESGKIARDERGYILRYQAGMKATQWLGDNLTLHFSATDALFVPLENPLWQFSIRFRLPQVGEIKPLGVIDVDAQNGVVRPLSRQQLHTIQERVHAIIRYRELATAA
jgi:hypothetical protein